MLPNVCQYNILPVGLCPVYIHKSIIYYSWQYFKNTNYYLVILFIMSPLCTQRWGHVGLPLSTQCFCRISVSLCVPFISVQRFLSCRRSNTRRWPNAGLMLAHRLFVATLNVGQRHRRRANINPALVQSIVPVPPACRYCQHEVLTRAEWILASTGDAAQLLTVIGSVSACTRRQQ